jgi:two-component system, OmpR family, sensor kinase
VTSPAPSYFASLTPPEPARDSLVDSHDWFGPPEPRGRWWTRNPLRVKLVALILVLVALALVFISVASTVFLNRYLTDRADTQLIAFAKTVNGMAPGSNVVVPPDYFFIRQEGLDGHWQLYGELKNDDLPAVGTDPSYLQDHLNKPFTQSAQDGKYRWRILITNVGGSVAIVGQNLYNDENTLDRLVIVELLVGVAVLVTLALAGAWLVRVSLLPLTAIERTATAITAGDLTQRVPELDPRTELGQLSFVLNGMLTQVESLFRARQASEHRAVRSEEKMRQFIADASHELRTPLTTIRGFAELYRQGAAPDPAEVLRRIENEAARMGLLVEDLLLLARLDRERPLRPTPVQLADLISDAASAAHAVAPDRAIEVDIQQSDEPLVVNGDEGRLRQIVDNLVTNALTHTPPGTPVTLRLRAEPAEGTEPAAAPGPAPAGTAPGPAAPAPGNARPAPGPAGPAVPAPGAGVGVGARQAVIEVSDQGPGLTPDQAERVFERFYRVDKARTRRAASDADRLNAPHSGAGLGLAIVAALVAAHEGSVEVESIPGGGATFRVRLPLA